MVYAGALIAEVMIYSDAPADYYLAAAARDLIKAFPYATGAAALWIVIAYFFHQSIVDAVTGGAGRDAAAAAAALQSAGKSLHLARHPDAEAEDHRKRGAERLRDRAQPAAICRHRHHRPAERAQRPGDRGGARPRAHPHPQRRRADDGDRGDHRRRGRLLRRTVLPELYQLRLLRRLWRLWPRLVVIVIFVLLFGQQPKGLRRRRRHCHHRCGRR